jgi:hypothetical protein
MSVLLDSSLVTRQEVLVDVSKLFLFLGIPDARLNVIERSPGDSAATIARNENILFGIDAAMPMSWFRERFARIGDKRVEEELTADVLSRTAGFLARRARDDARIDRIEFIVTRLLTRELPDGRLVVLPPADCFSLLNDLALGISADGDTREKVVKYCLGAVERLHDATSIEALLTGGRYLELQGYKKALREKRLDTAVLYACVLASVAITNHLLRFAAVEGLSRRALLARVASTELSVEKILSVVEDVDASKGQVTFQTKAKLRDDPRVRLAAACAASVCAWIAFSPPGPSAEIEELTSERYSTISLTLQNASLSNDDTPRLLVGTVSPTKWSGLTPAERRRVAVTLVRGTRQEEALVGVFSVGPRIVAVVEDGELSWLE